MERKRVKQIQRERVIKKCTATNTEGQNQQVAESERRVSAPENGQLGSSNRRWPPRRPGIGRQGRKSNPRRRRVRQHPRGRPSKPWRQRRPGKHRRHSRCRPRPRTPPGKCPRRNPCRRWPPRRSRRRQGKSRGHRKAQWWGRNNRRGNSSRKFGPSVLGTGRHCTRRRP